MATLRNEDYTDRELLHVIADAVDSDGLATSEEIATKLGVSPNGSNRSPGGKISVRLAWMKRFGLLETVDPKSAGVEPRETGYAVLWRITPIGEEIMGGRLTKPIENAIQQMGPGASVMMMRGVMQRSYVGGRREVAAAVRREYLHHAAKRH